MAYQALYRKFRPIDFEEVSGQDHIVQTLRNQLKSDRIGHAYVFSGTRGTGKTSVAKILAKAVNCENLNNGNPCGTCSSCVSITQGSALNVREIDAASNNGVDHIRAIIEDIAYPPVVGKKKVYIIDEAHMVSPQAFNALLKTIEEPPSYAVFILATTEINKIPITIRSRCQRYDFRRITSEVIAERMNELKEIEGISIDDRAVKYLARQADGSMRDALSLFDQCISFYYGENITYDMVLSMLGTADIDLFTNLFSAIRDHDAKAAIDTVEEAINRGMEPETFVSDFTWYLRNLLLVKNGEKLEDVADISTENEIIFMEMANNSDQEFIMRSISVLSELIPQIKFSTVKRVCLETGIIRLCVPQLDRDYEALLDRIKVLEQNPRPSAAPAQRTKVIPVQRPEEVPTPRPEAKLPTAKPERPDLDSIETEPSTDTTEEKLKPTIVSEDGDFLDLWGAYIRSLDPPFAPIASMGVPVQTGESSAIIYFEEKKAGARAYSKEENQKALREKINKLAGREYDITIKICSSGDMPVVEENEDSSLETDIFANAMALGIAVETEE